MALDKKYYNIRRFKNGVDMGVIDIPQEHLEMTLRNHPDWVNLGEIKMALEQVAPPDISKVGFHCPICGNAFGSEKVLQMHKLIHLLPWPCPICGNAFGSEKVLQMHKLIHVPQKTTLNPPEVPVVKKPALKVGKIKPKENAKRTPTKRKRKTA